MIPTPRQEARHAAASDGCMQAPAENMSFEARVLSLRGGFLVEGEIERVFPLFSPRGEESWVPGWSWEPIHPHGGDWVQGQIFRTQEERGEAIWVVTRLEPGEHRVEYHRVEPGRYVARIAVRCAVAPGSRVSVATEYHFTGLSDAGNADIAQMSDEAYAAKMERWRVWVADLLARDPGGS